MTHWHREWSNSRTQKKRTATVKKLTHELRKLRIEWGTHRVMWHCGGSECLLPGWKKSGLQREGKGSGLFAGKTNLGGENHDMRGSENQPVSRENPTWKGKSICEQRKPTREGGKLTGEYEKNRPLGGKKNR